MSKSSCGKPKKSWMVRGRGIAVTAVALMYQCADTTRMARGRGTERPNARHAEVYRLLASGFIGLPCPKKAAGMRGWPVDVTAGSSIGEPSRRRLEQRR